MAAIVLVPPTEAMEHQPPPRKKVKRTSNACFRCKSRKQKCNGETPVCGTCSYAEASCIYPENKKKQSHGFDTHVYVSALENRCAMLEAKLQQVDPSSDEISDHLRISGTSVSKHCQKVASSRPNSDTLSDSRNETISSSSDSPLNHSFESLTNDSVENSLSNGHQFMYDENPGVAMDEVSHESPLPLLPSVSSVFSAVIDHHHPLNMMSSKDVIVPQSSSSATVSSGSDHLMNHFLPLHPTLLPPSSNLRTQFPDQQHPVSPPLSQDHPSQQPQQDVNEDRVAQHVRFLSLKAFADPYLGPSSGLSFIKMTKTSMRKGGVLSPTPFQPLVPRLLKEARSPTSTSQSSDGGSIPVPCVPEDSLADALYISSYKHIQARYPFMQWPLFLSFHSRRKSICVDPRELNESDDRVAAFFLWMVYAVGASRNNDLSGHQLKSTAEEYYEASQLFLDDVLARHDIVTVQALALTSMYSFRASNGPAVWHLMGFAMRISIEHGLHRAIHPMLRERDPLRAEVRNRTFWAVYVLDRLAAINLGRPLSIADSDIDVELPLDIDCFCTDAKTINAAYKAQAAGIAPTSVTSMTSAIHWIKLYQIRSQISVRVYSPNRETLTSEDVNNLLIPLEAWRARIPETSSGSVPMISTEKMERTYHFTRLLVLRSILSQKTNPTDPLVQRIAESAAAICETGKRLLSSDHGNRSMACLYQDFVSGLTLLLALSINRTAISMSRSSRAIRACSSVLSVYASLFAEAESFRDMFEDILDGMDDEEPSEKVSTSTEGVTWQNKVQNLGGLFTGNPRDDFVSFLNNVGFTNELSNGAQNSTQDVAFSSISTGFLDPSVPHPPRFQHQQLQMLLSPFPVANTPAFGSAVVAGPDNDRGQLSSFNFAELFDQAGSLNLPLDEAGHQWFDEVT